jgi:hypothetical protein
MLLRGTLEEVEPTAIFLSLLGELIEELLLAPLGAKLVRVPAISDKAKPSGATECAPFHGRLPFWKLASSIVRAKL